MLVLQSPILNHDPYGRWWAFSITKRWLRHCIHDKVSRWKRRWWENDNYSIEYFSMVNGTTWTADWNYCRQQGCSCGGVHWLVTPSRFVVSDGGIIERNYVSNSWNYPGWKSPYSYGSITEYNIKRFNATIDPILNKIGEFKSGDKVDLFAFLKQLNITFEDLQKSPTYIAKNGNYNNFCTDWSHTGGSWWGQTTQCFLYIVTTRK